MKRIFLLFVTLCVAQIGFAQLKVDATGNTLFSGNIYIGGTSNSLATTGNTPLVFKVNNTVESGYTGSSGNYKVAFGYGALSNTTGGYNTAIGYEALRANTGGTHNTANGHAALCANTTGYANTATGTGALRFNTTGIRSTANGHYTLYFNTTGSFNTATGMEALRENTTGSYNTAIGSEALFSNTNGSYNTANGYYALYKNTSGFHNTANGSFALRTNTTGTHNTANGYNALYSNTEGSYNTANGYYALYANTYGVNNTANGFYALVSNTIGSYNTANGYYALYTNTTGSNNTAIGTYADISSNNLSNATAIGYNATATASNQVRIGNYSVTSIGGYTTWTNISDGRAKKNIRADVPGLNFINSLQPVTYNLDLDAIDELLKSDDSKINRLNDSLRTARSSEEKEFEAKSRAAKQKQLQTGFVAQDVEKIAKSIGYDFSGVDVDEKGIYGLRYAEFVVPLVKAVQELSEKNDSIAALQELSEKNNAELREQVNELIEAMKKQQDIINDMKTICYAPELRPADEVGGENKSKDNAVISTGQAKLFQNTPNPFNQTTGIGYFIPETVGSANIYIYDVNGVQQRNISIAERALQAGIYFYTLICNGKPVDTKQMILTR